MIVIPALDVRAGACVQSSVVPDGAHRAELREPASAAQYWARCGFSRVQLMDVDAEAGRSSNTAIVNGVLSEHVALLQVGGGVRSAERAEELLANGARFVLTRAPATEGYGWLGELADAHPDSVLVSIDARDQRVVSATSSPGSRVIAVVEELSRLRLAGIVVTAVQRRGLMRGGDVRLMMEVVDASTVPILAAGGVGGRRDLDELADCGVFGTIVGTALYSGALEPRLVAEEYAR